jgi:hypothetical protein
VHTSSTANGAGDLVLRVFNIATGIWSTAPQAPTGVGNRPFGGDDHVAVQLVGNDVYAFFGVADGGDDRAVAYQKYSGPGASGAWSPSATVLSASGRCNLDRIVTVGPGTPANRVLAVVAAGDNPNDGSPIDLEWWAIPLGPAVFSTFGNGCSGSGGQPWLDAHPGETPVLGQNLDLQFSWLPANQVNVVLAILGLSNTIWPPFPLPLPLEVFGMTDCRLYVSFDFTGLLIGQNGECNWTIPIPNNPAITGSIFYVQGFVADIGINPAGVVASNGGTILIGSH